MNPGFADETPLNPFDAWKGANFRLRIRQVEGWRNYDKSEFDAQSGLFDGNDEAIGEIWNIEHKLAPFTDPSNFKTYDELKSRLNKVLDLDGEDQRGSREDETRGDGGATALPEVGKEAPGWSAEEVKTMTSSTVEKASEPDPELDYFRKLAAADDEEPPF